MIFEPVEFISGIRSHSLVLGADAGHSLSDVLSLALAWGALISAKRQPGAKKTYGFWYTLILAALINAVTLLVAVGAIA